MPQRERLTKASDSATLPCSHVSYTFQAAATSLFARSAGDCKVSRVFRRSLARETPPEGIRTPGAWKARWGWNPGRAGISWSMKRILVCDRGDLKEWYGQAAADGGPLRLRRLEQPAGWN